MAAARDRDDGATEVAGNTARNVSQATSQASRYAANTARSVANATGNAVGIDHVDIIGTPRLGLPMPVVYANDSGANLANQTIDLIGRSGTKAVTLPGLVVARDGTSRDVITHEGIHFEEWAITSILTGNPLTWHSAYLVEMTANTIWYGSTDEAYEVSSFENRARDYVTPDRTPRPVSPWLPDLIKRELQRINSIW